MREIKFRVWNGEEWIGVYPPGCEIDPNDYGLWDDLVFQQYTGIKDEHGKDVYEGDIVTFTGFPEKKHEVIWDEYGFDFENMDNRGELFTEYEQESLTHYEFKVIGNIYEKN